MTAEDEPILHRIFEQLGGIQAQLSAGSRRHAEFARGLVDLDIKVDGVSERLGKVEAQAARIAVIEPTVWNLEGRRIESAAVKKFFGVVFTKAHVVYGIVAGGIGAVLTAAGTFLSHLFPGAPPAH